MELTTEQYNRVMRFIDADMSLEEIAAFKQELIANPEMRAQLDFEQSVRDVFAEKQALFTQQEKPVIRGSFVKRNSWLIAAAAVIFIVALTIVILKREKPYRNNDTAAGKDTILVKKDDAVAALDKPAGNVKTALAETLFSKYFVKDSLPETYPMVIAEELNQYATGNYDPIQQLNLSNLPETRGTNALADKQTAQQLGHYYKAISYLEKGSLQQAIINLKWVTSNSKNKLLTAKAEWYLALAYLKNSDINESLTLLKKIAHNQSNAIYSSKASLLLESIKNQR